MLAANIQADLLILMSDVDGIYNKPPWEDGARLMHTYTSTDRDLIQFGKKSKVSGYRDVICKYKCRRKTQDNLNRNFEIVKDDGLCSIVM